MKNVIIIILLPFTILSQNHNTFRIEFNTDFRGFEMGEFNQRINDPAYIDKFYYDELTHISLTEGLNFEMSVFYRPFQFISFGVYGGYQSGKTERDIRVILNQYDIYTPNDTFPGKRMFEVQSINAGLNASLLFNEMGFWKSRPQLARFEASLNLQIGIGWASFNTYDSFEGLIDNDIRRFYYSSGLQLISTLKIGYLLTKGKYLSSVGLKFGYQYFQTSDLQSEGDAYYPYNRKTKLDFSGFNVGLYLSIAR